jgi:hypothetical protein
MKKFEAAPWNPTKPLSHETDSKRRRRKARCQREKTQSLRHEIENLEA